MNKEFLHTGVICRPRTAGRTYENMLRAYNHAKLNGYTDVVLHFIDPHVRELEKANLHYHKIINRLSRKIQKKNKRIKELELEVHKLRHYRLIQHTHYGKTSNQVIVDEFITDKGGSNE